MGKPKTIKNLTLIFKESYKWRNSDLSSNGENTKFKIFSFLNISLIIIATLVSIFKFEFNDTVLNGILTFASIYSSLIIPVIIMVYDKYVQNPISNLTTTQQQSEGGRERIKIFKNFTSRFVFTALETVLIAIIIIIFILSYRGLDIEMNGINILDYKFLPLNEISSRTFWETLQFQFFKTSFIFFLSKFLYFIFYSIGALADFFNDGLKEFDS